MGRIRSTHPDQWTDEYFVQCSALARLLAIGLRNIADDNGIFPWKPMQLRWQILPNDNANADELLDELVQTRQIMQFEIDGNAFGMIRNFQRFQSPQRPSFKHPTPSENLLVGGYSIHEKYMSTHGGVQESAHNPNAGEGSGEGSGEGKKKIAPRRAASTPEVPEDSIMEFPCIGDPKVWHLRKAKAQEWRECYGVACDVDAELRKALQWLRDNPRKRKTAGGMGKFLNGWIQRGINSGRASKPNQQYDGKAVDWVEAAR